MSKTRLGVIFGSRSVEHEVSIITAVQLMKHIDRTKYDVVPIYVDKQGRWLRGSEELTAYGSSRQSFAPFALTLEPGTNDIDVAIICCHGTLGEDGTIQGLLELAGVPYQGPGVLGSAVGMDKIMTKMVLASSGIPVVSYQWFTAHEWAEDRETVMKRLSELTYPLFVKPSNLGSSVGITKATDQKTLKEAIAVALSFDSRVIVEEGIEDMKEINVSVLGYDDFVASIPEEPIASGELLSYADKYEGGGKKSGGMASLKRRIPAPIPASLTKTLQDAAIAAVKACDGSGVIRVDMIVKPESNEYWINELNTIPGSMSFYLWEASGVLYPELIDRLVEIAKKRSQDHQSRITSIQTSIIK